MSFLVSVKYINVFCFLSFMNYDRTHFGRVLQYLTQLRFNKDFDTISVEGGEYLSEAKSEYKSASILASHTSEHDIFVLDHSLMRQFGKDQFPVFVMRDTLRVRLAENIYLPQKLSRWLYTRQAGSSIPIDQKNSRALFQAIPAINAVFEDGKFLVIFPGATRAFGPVNGLTELTASLYSLVLKKARLDEGHCIVPCSISYDNERRDAKVTYSKPLDVASFDGSRTLGQAVTKQIADLSGTTLENIADEKKVQEHIRKERY